VLKIIGWISWKKLVSCVCETPVTPDWYDGVFRPRNQQWSTSYCAHWLKCERREELALSQEEVEPGTHRTVHQIARETGITKSSVHRIIHRDLKFECFKKRRAQDLTEANKNKRLACSRKLLRRYAEHSVPFIWFTDEKLFRVAPPVNLQNDRPYANAGTRKKQLSADLLLRKRSTFSKSLMVSIGVSLLGYTNLIFIDPGVKINGSYYCDMLLRQQLLPTICSVSGDFFTFQQDSAPSHRPLRLLHCCQQRHPTSSAHRIGRRTVQISIRWTTRFGGFYRNESTAPRSVTSTIWKNTTDWRVASIWSELYWQRSEPVAWSTAQMYPCKRGTLWTSI